MKRFIFLVAIGFFIFTPKAGAQDMFLTKSDLYYKDIPSVDTIPVLSKDPWFSLQWYLKNTGQKIKGTGGIETTGKAGVDISAEASWNRNYLGEGVKIAVVDTGANTNHIDLQNQFLGSDRNWNFLDQTGNVLNESSHGSFVAGIIGAEKDNDLGIAGILPESSLYIYKAGSEASLDAEAIAASFNRAGEEGISIVNGSFGGGYSKEIENAIVSNPNVLFVFAAGNESGNNDFNPLYPCSLPAENIVCVAATDNKDRLASFSNFGKNTVDIAAPGQDIISTYIGNSYALGDGTSFASPIAAAVAGIIKERYPAYTTTQLKQALLLSGDVLSSLKGKTVIKRRVNAEKAALSKKIALPALKAGAKSQKKDGVFVFGGKAQFFFKSDRKTDQFECRLNRSLLWSGCSSPFETQRGGLRAGRHHFFVRAVRLGGVTSQEKKLAFSISYRKPSLQLVSSKKTRSGLSFSIKTSGRLKCFWKKGSWKRFNCKSIKTSSRLVTIRLISKNSLGNISQKYIKVKR